MEIPSLVNRAVILGVAHQENLAFSLAWRRADRFLHLPLLGTNEMVNQILTTIVFSVNNLRRAFEGNNKCFRRVDGKRGSNAGEGHLLVPRCLGSAWVRI